VIFRHQNKGKKFEYILCAQILSFRGTVQQRFDLNL